MCPLSFPAPARAHPSTQLPLSHAVPADAVLRLPPDGRTHRLAVRPPAEHAAGRAVPRGPGSVSCSLQHALWSISPLDCAEAPAPASGCLQALLVAAPTNGLAGLLALCSSHGTSLLVSTTLREDERSIQ